jgi:acetyltransferase-like isoleucine patch superfamily enzyme
VRYFLHRIKAKLSRIFFAINNRYRFYGLGKDSSLLRPFRVDGYDGIQIGDRTVFQSGAWIFCGSMGINKSEPKLRIGSRCEFGFNNHISAVRHIEIGDDVLTANNVYIADNIHEYENISLPIKLQGTKFKNSVLIGSGSWLGENAVIIGASVGRNSIIGANSVVTKDIPDYCVAVGIPAKVIRRYDINTSKWIAVNEDPSKTKILLR